MTAFFYNTNIPIEELDIVIGVYSDDGITYNKPYVGREINGFDLITVMNDLGEIDCYNVENFKKYNGETLI